MNWLGRILSEAWKCYWRKFPVIAVVILIVWLPIELFASHLIYFEFGEEGTAKVDRYYRTLTTFVGVIGDGAVIAIVLASLLGKSLMPGEAVSISLSAWGRLFVGRFLAGLIILGGFILIVVPGLYCFVKLSLIDQVIMNERRSARENVKRTFELTRGKVPHFIAIHVIYVLLGAIAFFTSVAAVSAFSTTENWITEAFLALAYDFGEAFGVVCMTVAYADLAGRETINVELFGPDRSDRSILELQENRSMDGTDGEKTA